MTATAIPDDPRHSAEDLGKTVTLFLRVRRGDEGAWDAFHERILPKLKREFHGQLPQASRGVWSTEDLVQDALVRFLARMKAFEPRHDGAVRAFLWTIGHNLVRDRARYIIRRPPIDALEGDFESGGPSPLDEAIGVDLLARYLGALHRLNETDQQMVTMRVEQGASYEAIATATGKPSADAARVALNRALARLAKLMGRARASKSDVPGAEAVA